MTSRMILISTNHPQKRFPGKDIERAVRTVFRNEQERLPMLSVICTDDRFMKKINREFLEHNYVTDVIAFPLGEDGGVEGEIYVNLDAAARQAKEYGVTYSNECTRLFVHAALHLCGYRDKTKKEKKRMTQREELYLHRLSQK